MFRPMLLASIAALTLMGVTHVLANDSSAELATGGLVFIKNANVEMRSEDLFISQRRSARNTPSPEPDSQFHRRLAGCGVWSCRSALSPYNVTPCKSLEYPCHHPFRVRSCGCIIRHPP